MKLGVTDVQYILWSRADFYLVRFFVTTTLLVGPNKCLSVYFESFNAET